MGVYDVTQNAGWVSVGVDHDTAAFAAQSIRRWWESMGAEAYPDARKLPITADSGGSKAASINKGSDWVQRQIYLHLDGE
jgi:Rhodopirellula transposase DDE domain